jgi:hypothetical protein
MIVSPFSHYLDLLKHDLPDELISDVSFSNIRKMASQVPGALAFSAFGFECRMGDREPAADFLFSLQKNNSGPEILSGKLPESDFDTDLFSIPQWRQVRCFGEQWADPPEPLYAGIDDVWLEFDVSDPSGQAGKAPSLFFAPFHATRDLHGKDPDPNEGLRLLETVFFWLKGRAPGVSATRGWKKCLEILPRVPDLFQVGLMIARSDSDTLRMCIQAPDGVAVKRILSRLGWPGNYSTLDDILKKIAPFFDRLCLHVDVGADISGKIGIECKFPHRRDSSREPLWYPFLDFLLETGLCLPAKRSGLLAYPGYRSTNMDMCPPPLARMADHLYPLYKSFFVRTLYHVKLVFRENGELEAKAYLGINHLWKGLVDDSELERGRWGIIG